MYTDPINHHHMQDSCVPLYHDTFFHSPQRSGDFHHSGIFQVFSINCTSLYTCVCIIIAAVQVNSYCLLSLQAVYVVYVHVVLGLG